MIQLWPPLHGDSISCLKCYIMRNRHTRWQLVNGAVAVLVSALHTMAATGRFCAGTTQSSMPIMQYVQVLAGALSDLKADGIEGPLFERVQTRTINPKAVTMGQLYGEADRATQEWKDGVLGLTFRQLASDPCPDRKW